MEKGFRGLNNPNPSPRSHAPVDGAVGPVHLLPKRHRGPHHRHRAARAGAGHPRGDRVHRPNLPPQVRGYAALFR